MTEALRSVPPAPSRFLGRATLRVLDGMLPELEGGALVVVMPDGTTRRYGSGSEVTMRVRSLRLLSRIAARGALGFGESYVAGEWDSDDLPEVLALLLANAEAARERHAGWHRLMTARPRLRHRNGLSRARRRISYHYDLGNELFRLMLDDTMTYSCAIFEDGGEPLETAQLRKLRRVCDRLALEPGDRVLEIGCGWGSFALVAAGEYGARVTGLTLSQEQAALARQRVAAAGVSHLVEIREQDYRLVDESYTKVASIEMLEAIGADQWPTFFSAVDRALEPGGRAVVQTILIPDQRFERYRRTPDWIERYVFPGCLIPSLGAIARAVERSSSLQILGVEEIGPHYAETLRRWRRRFRDSLPAVRALGYDRPFERTWDYYLASCEAGFSTRWLRDAQLVLE